MINTVNRVFESTTLVEMLKNKCLERDANGRTIETPIVPDSAQRAQVTVDEVFEQVTNQKVVHVSDCVKESHPEVVVVVLLDTTDVSKELHPKANHVEDVDDTVHQGAVQEVLPTHMLLQVPREDPDEDQAEEAPLVVAIAKYIVAVGFVR